MSKKLFRFINRITYFGIEDNDSYLEKFRKRVLNRTFFIIAVSCLIFVLQILFLEDKENTLIPLLMGLISTGSLLFTYFKKFNWASVMLSVVFPTLFLGAIIIYGDALKLDYTISFFIVLVLTLYDGIRSRILNIGYLILLQVVSFYYTSHYHSIYEQYVDFNDSLIVLTFTTLGLFILVFQFIRAGKSFQEEQKKLNEDLDAKNRQLQQNIADKMLLNKELQKKTRDLQQSNDFLESYTYITSHDLKSPMRTILSFSELLSKKLKNVQDEDVQDYLNFIKTGALQFNAIIEGIIENAQNNRSSLQLESVDCNELMEQLESRLRFKLEQNRAVLRYERLPVIWADRRMITQIFEKLVDNGLKYNTSERPAVFISHQETDDIYEFSVADNGIGIQAPYQEDVFKMFKKLHRPEEFSGSGVGLALCKKIVELHQGEIWLDQLAGSGSVFRFTIPKKAVLQKKDPESPMTREFGTT